jgi:signal transduction histidine kinase
MLLPRRTARLRLTLLYGGACLTFGAILLAITYLFTWSVFTGAMAAHPVPTASSASASAQQPGQSDPQSGAGQAQAATVDRLQLLAGSGIALGIVTLAAAGAGWLLAGRVLRPLSTITAAARRISASSLHERLALQGPDDELKELGDTLDGLFARLEASFAAQRRFAANASHELRTPLTRERALLQVTLADPAAPPRPGRPSAGNCSPPTPNRNGSSRPCLPWQAAKRVSASAIRSTSRRSRRPPSMSLAPGSTASA